MGRSSTRPYTCHAALAIVCSLFTHECLAQSPPVNGMQNNTPEVHAFVHARIVQSPGKTIDDGTLVIRDGVIIGVGSVSPPADARIWDMQGMTLYPGFIDAFSDYGMPKPRQREQPTGAPELRTTEQRGPASWNPSVLADRNAAELFLPDPRAAEGFRSQGVTAALIVPQEGIFRGTSALVTLGIGRANDQIVAPRVAQQVTTFPGRTGTYPGSPMGVHALVRQTFMDAGWYQKAQAAYRKEPSLPRPETSAPLDALADAARGAQPVIIETEDDNGILRAHALASELNLQVIARGNGEEYRRLDDIRKTGIPLLLPVNFPEPPTVGTAEEALRVSLTQLRHWDEAPENPSRLQKAGIRFAFTTSTLKDPSTFLKQVRKAVERGLAPTDALAALTTVPAQLFGAEKIIGTLERGKLANFIVTDGDVFQPKTTVRETWVQGHRYPVAPRPDVDPRGTWRAALSGGSPSDTLLIVFKGEAEKPQGTVKRNGEARVTNAQVSAGLLTFRFAGDSLGYPGVILMTAAVFNTKFEGNGMWGDGKTFAWSATRTAAFIPEPDTAKPKPVSMASYAMNYPFAEFGRRSLPAQPDAVFIKDATLWTSGPQGRLEHADILIRKGTIVDIGSSLTPPSGALLIDGKGKHITAGLIDAHSHTATNGGVNEYTQAVTPEVRVGDFMDPDDMSIYRQLAGGLTAAHVLHGSANPIGGQCQLIKLRWGASGDEMKFEGAPRTIKFALGENVKQSGGGGPTRRYPVTRMGVEQVIRDAFRAARDYEKAWNRYNETKSGIPPRRDLRMEALVDVLHGKLLIHCHSYRQDEILAMMRVAEEFGIRVRSFQHILEGYKVADAMARHGASGSTFSDWWAYKFEVYDAIPYNAALMHDQGVVVSFNSDSDELARRLNLEAAKAVKYGGLSEEEALKLVTINPAKQLGVDARVGSLERGKSADFVLWSGNPLSTSTVCEQTWIDGRRYFDRDEDRALNDEIQHERSVLIQKILTAEKPAGQDGAGPPRRGRGESSTHVDLKMEARP